MAQHTLCLILSLLFCIFCAACFAAETVYKPDGNITAHVWTNASSPSFVYPELSNTDFGIPKLQSKPNLGICVSGGGMRATTVAYGWVRALWQMGVLQKARYISSNSGGSWFNGAMSYTQVPMKQFFGPYIPPEQLDFGTARSLSPGSYGQIINQAAPMMDILGSTVVDALSSRTDVRAWSDAIGQAFLEPFGVGKHESSMTTLGTKGRVHERVAAQAPSIPFFTAGTQDRPFPIILGSLILRNESRIFFPFEFTPLYYGSPPLQLDTEPIVIGGGMVEPLGFNSPPPAEGVISPDGSKSVSVATVSSVSLVQAVGVSSSFVSQKTQGGKEGREELLSVEMFDYWNQWNFEGLPKVHSGDGGGHDNQAISPLLRRGVENIIAGSATVCDPLTNATDYAKCQWDISGLYGAVPLDVGPIDGVEPTVYNKMLQVFPTDGYTEFYEAMRTKVEAGKAAYVKQSLRVLPNKHLGVKGGYTVNLLWLLNKKTASWEDSLAKDLKQFLDRARGGRTIASKLDEVNPFSASTLKDFPYVSTFAMNYPPELVQTMSQLASWTAMQAKNDIMAMAAAKPQTAPAAAAGVTAATAAAATAKPATAAAAKPGAATAAAGKPGAAAAAPVAAPVTGTADAAKATVKPAAAAAAVAPVAAGVKPAVAPAAAPAVAPAAVKPAATNAANSTKV